MTPALNREAKLRRIEYGRGVRRIVDATPARDHIHTLMGRGWSVRAIAGAANLSVQSVHRIHRERQNANRITVAKILAVPLDSLPNRPSAQVTEPFVSRIGTVRRIQALLLMGWGHAEMTRRAGVRTAVALHQQGTWVTRTTHDKVAALYDDLSMTPGPSTKATAYARRFGYASPLAWDDIDHDPGPTVDAAPQTQHEESVDDVVVQRVLDGQPRPRKLTSAEAAEVFRLLRARGVSTFEMENTYGIAPGRYTTREAS